MAAIGDIHYGVEGGPLGPHLEQLAQEADVLLVAGDLTQHGDPEEAGELVRDLERLEMPKVIVLGNHDYHQDREADIVALLEAAGAIVLESEGEVVQVDGTRLGVAGLKGFGGGFAGCSVTDFGEPEVRLFAHLMSRAGADLGTALEAVRDQDPDVTVALLHYAPVEATLVGEPPQLWPFLGNYLLAEAVDRVGADLVLHGHAHHGSPRGRTPKGRPVLNVAQPVLKKPYELIELGAA
ncbi:MAG TPA: metallophosphoesterase [Candidatus Dormibacteraeota bacterium]